MMKTAHIKDGMFFVMNVPAISGLSMYGGFEFQMLSKGFPYYDYFVYNGYEMETCMLVNLSLMLTAGLLYWLFDSKIADALKITLSVLFSLTGIVRVVLMLFSPLDVVFFTFIGILLLETIIMAIAYYNTSK